jgi:RNA recognition motif-containing protein
MYSRLYVRLHTGMDADDLADRFGKSLKKTASLKIEVMKNSQGESRGFGYITLATEEDGSFLVDTYNNTKWKGFRIVIEPANPTYLERLTNEWEEIEATKHGVEEKRDAAFKIDEMPKHSHGYSSALTTTFRLRPRPGADVRKESPLFSLSYKLC